MNVQLTQTENKKLAIFDHTIQLIHIRGFHGTPMSLIAQHAGVAIGTIYHYFPSKTDLILSLFKHTKLKLRNYLFEKDNTDQCFEARFKDTLSRFILFYWKYPEILNFFDQFYSSPYYQMVKDKKHEETMCGENVILNFIKEGVAKGELKDIDPTITSTIFLSTAIGIVKKSIIENQEISPQHMDVFVDILWDGVKQST
ncbi:TetR/AcrR family transcriptional regulator [Sphingobacteriaceae bacterium WQ 2009]|uniref:TetR/AcrR family transcriptional regulator n=1 Tax=Rhinopithecimicrobium faecis TaxID=2820698 RepID=A0A8T4HFB2_9SPHI|nr:TetR/AcrR family transcriptional regulator [Sphingobacteriaceae bacterium WQ 2009]